MHRDSRMQSMALTIDRVRKCNVLECEKPSVTRLRLGIFHNFDCYTRYHCKKKENISFPNRYTLIRCLPSATVFT